MTSVQRCESIINFIDFFTPDRRFQSKIEVRARACVRAYMRTTKDKVA